MKIILQDFEPQVIVAAKAMPVAVKVRKPRLRLDPAIAELRLFHAL